MKTPATCLLLSLFAAIATTGAAEQTIEVRLLKTAGASPSETTLKSLVDAPGAQVLPAYRSDLATAGATRLEQTSPFKYASEYSSEGKPTTFETQDLGLKGEVSVKPRGEFQELKLNLSGAITGTPQIYEVDGVQVTMPVFEKTTSEATIDVKKNEWSFVSAMQGEKSFFSWAIRISDAKQK